MNLRRWLDRRVSEALAAAGAPENSPAVVAPSGRVEFGDYQANGVMAAAKRLKTNPRQLAEKVLAALDLGPAAAKVEIAGPGFLNIHLSDDWLARELAARAADEKLGAEPAEHPQTVVVDYSAPNLAKEMHVGHLRSTIIGDCLARTLEFLGHRVVRQNHVGDWGTQFGMLTAYMEREEALALSELNAAGQDVGKVFSSHLPDLEVFYQKAKRLFDSDVAFAESSRRYVVRLQSGDPQITELWQRFRGLSLDHCRQVYERLGVTLTDADIRGESDYNDDLPKVVDELDRLGMLMESEGARCVFLDEFKGKDDQPLPLIVQKSDEGYLYATTDLAAIRYRVCELHADRVLYVVGSPQSLHFRMVFAVARKAGFAPASVSLEHVAFGSMLGEDNKPFKTRAGGTVKLMDLLGEAEKRALDLASQKSAELPDEQRTDIAHTVGIGAVKYADLSQNRNSDYVFSWDKMLSLEGNTAPYMQYAYARVRSIFRKGGGEEAEAAGDIRISEPAERKLAVKLLQFAEAIDTVAAECLPNVLCGYLYDLAGAFMGFYESCPVLQADPPTRASRLALCDLTARTIRTGLRLLGIETLEQM